MKIWNRIFFKLSYASIIMLLLTSSKPAALFRFELLNASSHSTKFNSSNCIFSLWDVKKSWNDFSVLGTFPANVGPTDVKNLLNSSAISCGFCIMILLTLISRGRFDFVFFTSYFFHNLQRPLRICFILMQQFWIIGCFSFFFLVFWIDFCSFCT